MGRTFDTPVYVATNFLESMIQQSGPNRSEVNDIVSTLMAGASGVVLAAEQLSEASCCLRFHCAFPVVYSGKWTPDSGIGEIWIGISSVKFPPRRHCF